MINCNESESGGSGGSSDPETRYDYNESGGSAGSWRVLKHQGVSASIMLDPPNALQKKLAIVTLI